MNWHQLIEERSYEMHQVIAAALHRDPSELVQVVDWIEQCLSDPDDEALRPRTHPAGV
jgi:hypothetical protein